ncbi:BnaA02g31050D [Brassica napus]|uniref:BnaA02g31050D protein n=1 Tax=Brassica napus TaxID=3708 RepID=A0A078H8L4_BRANA|nr:BnaA02g31050D [Brassica napus]
MEKQLHKTMEAAHVERAIRKIKLKGHHGGGVMKKRRTVGMKKRRTVGMKKRRTVVMTDEEGGGKFSAFISVIAEAFEE